MKSFIRFKFLKITSVFVFIFISLNCQSQQLPYQNTKLTPEERAKDLLPRLTLAEKAALMQNNSPAIPRLGIKAYEWWNEALHGVGRTGLATVFPQAIGMAASFNDALLFDVFTAVSDEARAKSNKYSEQGGLKRYQGLTYWTPNINIFRDPRWGRGQETYGEDPYLTSKLGVAVVKGLQGPDDAEYDKLHACAKHFAVHSGPEWNRHSYNAEKISPRDLWETYLPAFKDLVQKADVKEVMCAYNRYEGEPCCGSNRLLTQILRDEWNYKGLVVSDCWAIADFYRQNAHAIQTRPAPPPAAHTPAPRPATAHAPPQSPESPPNPTPSPAHAPSIQTPSRPYTHAPPVPPVPPPPRDSTPASIPPKPAHAPPPPPRASAPY